MGKTAHQRNNNQSNSDKNEPDQTDPVEALEKVGAADRDCEGQDEDHHKQSPSQNWSNHVIGVEQETAFTTGQYTQYQVVNCSSVSLTLRLRPSAQQGRPMRGY